MPTRYIKAATVAVVLPVQLYNKEQRCQRYEDCMHITCQLTDCTLRYQVVL